MTTVLRRRAAVALCTASALCLLVALVVPLAWGRGVAGLGALQTGGFGLPFILLGLLITYRRPGHPIGPSFLLAGFFSALQAASIAYADAALRPHGSHLLGAAYAGNLTQWIFAPGVLFGYTLPFLWFPDGARLSRRSRRIAGVAVVSTVLTCALNIIATGPLNNYKHVRNPLSVSLPGDGLLGALSIAAYVAALLLTVGVVLRRYRRSRGMHRLQMRWFMVGVVATGIAFIVQITMVVLTGDVGLSVLLLAVLPVCAGVAILRYRLFDIDRVISRTITYASVSAVLVAPYVLFAVLAGRLGRGSSLLVAAATLVALALLRPVHRRVQRRVDRRFNRESYDAARTVEAFAVRLRDEVDPDLVRDDLLATTVRALQPGEVSLWLA